MKPKFEQDLEKLLNEQLAMFEPGSGFGDPDARRNAEFLTTVTIARLGIESKKKIDRIQIYGLIFAIVQTILSLLALRR